MLEQLVEATEIKFVGAQGIGLAIDGFHTAIEIHQLDIFGLFQLFNLNAVTGNTVDLFDQCLLQSGGADAWGRHPKDVQQVGVKRHGI